MALVLADRVLETTAVAGTGDASLGGAVTGYQPFSVIGGGKTPYYTIVAIDDNGVPTGDWEVGIGTYVTSGNKLQRDTVLSSSNGGAKVYFASGTKQVFLDLPSEEVPLNVGDVVGPASAVANNFAAFNLTTGKLIKDSGYNASSFATAAQGAKADTAVQPGSLGSAAYLTAGAANGVATLDSGGKVPTSQIPQMGDLNYQGTWNATTNTPTLVSSSGTKGYYYVVSVSGSTNLNGITDWAVGDWAVFNGSVWQKIDNTDAVISVNGYTGTVVLTYTDVGAQPAGTYVNSVSATSPVTSSGGTTPTIAMPAATTSVSGYLTSTNWNTFNNKQDAFGSQTANYVYAAPNGSAGTPSFRALVAADIPSLSSSYIPYTGATTAVDLNAKTLVNVSHLGINTTTVPDILLRAIGDNNSTSRIAVRGYSSDANSSSIRVTKFRGTTSSPQAPQSGDSLGKFELAGYGTTSSSGYAQASFEGVATEAWGAIARGAKTLIKVTPNTTTTQVTAVTVDQDKSVTLAGALSVTGTTTLATSLTGLAKLTSGVVSTATSGTDYAPATSGTAILYGNGSGGFSSVTIGSGVSFAGGTLSATGSGGTVTSVTGTAPVVSSGGTTPAISMAAANTSTNGYLTSTDWNTFNNKLSAMVYPAAGIPNSTGSSWGTSYSTTGSGTTVALSTSPTFATSILGDFSNATVASRTLFKTSTTNASTGIYAVPNGTSTAASWQATNAADPTNASKILIATNGSTDVQLVSGINGTGTYLPLSFYTNGAEKMRLDTSGNLLVGTSSASTPSTTGYISTANTFGFKNRIINGAMVIDQRNAGASVTITANPQYTLDRWFAGVTAGSKISIQQNAGAVTPPTGFTKYLGVTSLAATSLGSTDLYYLQQSIEGFNTADLSFGTASASAITISFWVRSSLTGTFGAVLLNAGSNRSYPFNYTIASANTWTQITQTISGDVTGTWATDNTTGFQLRFGLGAGSTYSGTAGAWGTANVVTTTGATSVVGTNGATFYITGVQLEKGSTATSFDYRPYGTELNLCQRYYEIATVPTSTSIFVSYVYGGTQQFNYWQFKQTKRASPTVTVIAYVGGAITLYPGTEAVQLYNATTAFYVTGTAGAVGTTANAEL